MSVSVIEQKNYVAKIVNAYIVCYLDNWPWNLLNNFTLKNCFFGAANIVESSGNSMFIVAME